jgi:hypothetical protein
VLNAQTGFRRVRVAVTSVREPEPPVEIADEKRERLTAIVAHDEAGVQFFDRPGRREAGRAIADRT